MILCIGTTPTAQRTMIFPRVVSDAVNRAVEVHEHASGKSVNVARVAHTLGEKSLATGFLGGDRGEFIRRELDRARISHDFAKVATPTRLCTTVVDQSAGTATELVEESSPVAADEWIAMSRKFQSLVAGAAWCVMSGSLPPGGPLDFYARCVDAAVAVNCRVILDARGEPLRLALGTPGLIIKLNREELAATVGADTLSDTLLRDAMRNVCPADGGVIVTMGKEGADGFAGAEYWRVPAPKIDAISPIGSGDSFAAGLAVGLHRGQSLQEACRLASACGAANAMTPYSGHVDANVVARLLEEVQVSAWIP